METTVPAAAVKPKKESQALKNFRKNKRAMFGAAFIIVETLLVIFLPIILHLDPVSSDLTAGKYAAPSAAHWLGTDSIGRDLFARLLSGGRVSLFVGFASPAISVAIGLPLGLLAGYYRGAVEAVIMRIADIFMSFPSMILILCLVAVVGPSLATVILVIGVMGWTQIAKLVYGNVVSIRKKEYIESAKAAGCSDFYIIFHEILPNAISPVWVLLSFRVGGAITTESSLSFLGVGIQPPQASWGNIINAATELSVLMLRPWVWMPAGFLIVMTVISFNFIGEGVRDALDPKMKRVD
jgi:peptide/nickel transport system permease protein